MSIKYRRLVAVSFLFIFVSWAISAEVEEEAQTQPPRSRELPGVLEYISFDLRNVPAQEAVDYIARQSGANIVLQPGIDETVTLRLVDVPWRVALDILAKQIGCLVEEIRPGVLQVSRPPRVTLEAVEASFKKIVNILARQSGANVIVGSDVEDVPVNLRIEDIPWPQALQEIVKAAGYEIVREEEIVRVMTRESLAKQLETRTFQLRYVQPPASYRPRIETEYATDLRGGGAGAAAGFSAGPAGAPGAGQLDLSGQFPLFRALQNLKSEFGRLEYDPATNSIIATDTKPKLEEIQRIISIVDVDRPQVLVDVKFVTTGKVDLLDFGMDFSGPSGTGPEVLVSGAVIQTEFPFSTDRLAGTDIFTPGIISAEQLIAVLRFFKQDEESRVLQRPKLIVRDNEEATIFVGETIRFAETEAEAAQAGGLQFSIEEATNSPVDTGFQLLIHPRVVKGTDEVILTLIPKSEELVGTTSPIPGFDRFGTGVNTIDLPQTSSRTVVTSLKLHNGDTAVIGGLIVNNEVERTNKVPFFGDIPFLGYFFKNKFTDILEQNLLIFATVTIVRDINDSRAIYADYRDYDLPDSIDKAKEAREIPPEAEVIILEALPEVTEEGPEAVMEEPEAAVEEEVEMVEELEAVEAEPEAEAVMEEAEAVEEEVEAMEESEAVEEEAEPGLEEPAATEEEEIEAVEESEGAEEETEVLAEEAEAAAEETEPTAEETEPEETEPSEEESESEEISEESESAAEETELFEQY
jgi:type II secretory pathway component GspD/PulD (secretin)